MVKKYTDLTSSYRTVEKVFSVTAFHCAVHIIHSIALRTKLATTNTDVFHADRLQLVR